jgi:hypothetical protein
VVPKGVVGCPAQMRVWGVPGVIGRSSLSLVSKARENSPAMRVALRVTNLLVKSSLLS